MAVKHISFDLNCLPRIQYSSSGLEIIKLFSCSFHLSMNFFLLINTKIPTDDGIFKFIT